jgi:hypothetical protein
MPPPTPGAGRYAFGIEHGSNLVYRQTLAGDHMKYATYNSRFFVMHDQTGHIALTLAPITERG